MKAGYTPKQLEIASILEEITVSKDSGIPTEVIDAILERVGDEGERPRESDSPTSRDIETEIKTRLTDEPDWKKRAALAALLISRSLD